MNFAELQSVMENKANELKSMLSSIDPTTLSKEDGLYLLEKSKDTLDTMLGMLIDGVLNMSEDDFAATIGAMCATSAQEETIDL